MGQDLENMGVHVSARQCLQPLAGAQTPTPSPTQGRIGLLCGGGLCVSCPAPSPPQLGLPTTFLVARKLQTPICTEPGGTPELLALHTSWYGADTAAH